jgi:Arc/MetJ-type ribon-helix-helix transcriptional regulator
MTEVLPPDLQQFVRQELANGAYQSEADLMADAVRLLRDSHLAWKDLQADVQSRLERLDRGDAIEIQDDDGLRAFLREIEAEAREDLASEKNAKA